MSSIGGENGRERLPETWHDIEFEYLAQTFIDPTTFRVRVSHVMRALAGEVG